ncbi:hypothetical protein AB0I28_03200 [Phytomonospora sp. NPDC050363]|uniref:hypothetical protein n=1 Tax=Phytomonospora sp. NPDC050363 TaxID=3155642 RepID=UPI0033FB47E0
MDQESSEAVTVLSSEAADVTLRLVGIVHVTPDIGDLPGNFVDEIAARELPRCGPWPEEARHLLRHHNNRSALRRLTIAGPDEVEIVAEVLTVDQPSAHSASSCRGCVPGAPSVRPGCPPPPFPASRHPQRELASSPRTQRPKPVAK